MMATARSWYLITLSITLLVGIALKSSLNNHDTLLTFNAFVQPKQDMEEPRKMVGGFSGLDPKSNNDDLSSIGSFALAEFMQSEASFSVLPSQIQNGEIYPIILEASRQVVAGMNYKLTVGLIQENECLGGFKVTIWKQLSGELKTTSWGEVLGCEDIHTQFGEVLNEALMENNALRVEQEVQVEKGEVEPDE
jgi:hypothetical protein